MKLKEDWMYDRVVAGDAGCNGRFFFGVSTTGIYCLPSCSARKPLRKNTRFFASLDEARAAGLRACRKCRPDDFARGADPVLESIEALVAEMRTNPAAFADVRAVVRRSGFGSSRVFELFRLHYHATPAEVLLRARLDAAKALLVSGAAGLATIAADTGFESLSAFHDQFKRRNGLTPAAYRMLGKEVSGKNARDFEIELPPGYPLSYLRRALGRDHHSVTERLTGETYVTAARLGTGRSAGASLLSLHLSAETVKVECAPGAELEAHAAVVGLLGLDQDAAAFARLAKKLGLGRLVAGRPELRITQALTAFDGLLWAIIGQQINMPFAFLLRRRLTELCGKRAGEYGGESLYASPTPAALAALSESDLLPLQFSRQKANYVISIARLIVEGKFDPEALRSLSATRAERTLLALRGLGPWSVNYVMMRALGFADCVPYGDTGVTSGLQALLALEERPDVDATRRLMLPFSPWRSLATAHLWQFNRPEPQ